MSKKDEIYDLIVDRLIGAKYRFGDRIFVKDLVAETGVSRHPIMSALGRLSASGFVEIAPQVGCQVIDPAPETIADFYLMFGELEGLLAGLAAERRDDAQLAKLRDCNEEICGLLSAGPLAADRYVVANRNFHGLLHTMSRSGLVAERQRLNFNMSDFFINQAAGFDRHMDRAAREHAEIIEAIADRDRARAIAIMKLHISHISAGIMQHLGR